MAWLRSDALGLPVAPMASRLARKCAPCKGYQRGKRLEEIACYCLLFSVAAAQAVSGSDVGARGHQQAAAKLFDEQCIGATAPPTQGQRLLARMTDDHQFGSQIMR